MKKRTQLVHVSQEAETSDNTVRSIVLNLSVKRFELIKTLIVSCNRKYWLQMGFPSFRLYFEDRIGKSFRWFEENQLAFNRLKQLPEISKALKSGELQPTAVIEMVRVATPKNEKKWIKKGRDLSLRELKDEIRQVRQSPKGPEREGFVKMAGWYQAASEVPTIEKTKECARKLLGGQPHESKIWHLICMAAHSEFQHHISNAETSLGKK